VFHHGVVHRSGIWGVSVRNEADGKSGVIVGQARCGSISRREPTSAPCLMGIDAALSAATSSRSVGNADPKRHRRMLHPSIGCQASGGARD
jgi:hypothetical protein